MRNLEDLGLQLVRDVVEQQLACFLVEIAGQQEADVAEFETQHDGVTVDGVRSGQGPCEAVLVLGEAVDVDAWALGRVVEEAQGGFVARQKCLNRAEDAYVDAVVRQEVESSILAQGEALE